MGIDHEQASVSLVRYFLVSFLYDNILIAKVDSCAVGKAIETVKFLSQVVLTSLETYNSKFLETL